MLVWVYTCKNATMSRLNQNLFYQELLLRENDEDSPIPAPNSGHLHTGQCKRTGGCYNELVVAFFSTGGCVKGKKIYTC